MAVVGRPNPRKAYLHADGEDCSQAQANYLMGLNCRLSLTVEIRISTNPSTTCIFIKWIHGQTLWTRTVNSG